MISKKESKGTPTGPGDDVKLLHRVGAWISGLSGSLAGLTAIVYVFGYIATIWSNRLLGLGFDFLERDAFVYVAIGGNIAYSTAPYLLGAFIAVKLAVRLARVLWRWTGGRLESENRVRRAFQSLAPYGPLLATVLMALVFTYTVSQHLREAQEVRDILFAEQGEFDKWTAEVQRALIDQNREFLADRFDLLAWWASLAVALGLLAAPALAARRRITVLSVAAVLFLLASTLTLPMGYGVYIMSTHRAPVVALHADGGTSPILPARLIAQSDRGMLFWEECSKDLVWMAPGTITALTLDKPAPLLRKPDCSAHQANSETPATEGQSL